MAKRLQIAEGVIDKVRQNPPQFGALHWDGKLIRDTLGNSGEHLAILVSGSPEYTEGKLLGVPSLVDSTGKSQSDASYDLLEVWELVDNIVALVFDTTSSNSGVNKGAAKLLEERLNKKVFYLACRHHVLEIIVGAIWKLLFGKVLGPDNTLFAKFKDAWNDLDKTIAAETLKINDPWLSVVKTRVVHKLQTLLRRNDSKEITRDDYRECAENAVILLGGIPPRGIHYMKPGAVHQARWMACNLYAGKMFMFSKEMSYNEETFEHLRRINVFLNLFYVPLWMRASSGADAPYYDLQLFHDMIAYREVDKEIAEEVLRKLANHCWYLTEEVVPFVLFSNNPAVTEEIKQEIARKIMITPIPENFRLGKPVFRSIASDTTLTDLVGPDSHTLFQSLHIGNTWLGKPVNQWKEDPDFIVAETFVRNVKVVNDAAERGVKLMTDYATAITTDPQQKAAMLQCVEHHRRLYPDFQKRTLNK